MSARKLFNPGEDQQKVESVRVPKNCPDQYGKNGRIGVSTRKLLNLGEYCQKVESVRAPKKCPDQYEKILESV